MRQRGAISRTSLPSFTPRVGSVLALSLWLALSSLPFQLSSVVAAPPDSGAATESADPATARGSKAPDDSTPERVVSLPDEPGDASDSNRPEIRNRTTWGWPGIESVRRRGLEAPVELRQREVAPVAEEPDKGDGEPRPERASSDKERSSDREEPKKRTSQPRDIRVWPMRANSYTFTQAFGCVPQIANFYFPGEGCPASAPVVHSGIDLGAPEGTPFYAAASGWVTDSGYDREVGVPNTRIIIQHDGRNEGFATEYLHWIASFVEPGDYVEAGDQIGEVGSVGYSTGSHLHFSVVDLESGEHTDPVRWLPDDPGTQGYRGRRPDTRAQMRLPAGTTAGLPEEADPAPPPPPERVEVPESPKLDKAEQGKDRSSGKRKSKREERKADKRAKAEDQTDRSATESASAAETVGDDVANKGKDKERTRKRERNKNGQDKENAANGKDGGKRKSADESDEDATGKGANKGRRGNGNGNGRHNDKSDDEKVKQRKTNDRDQKDRDKLKGSAGEDLGGDENSGGSDDGGGGPGADGGGGKGDGDRGDIGNDSSGHDPKGDSGGTDDAGDSQTDGDPGDVDSAPSDVAAAQPAVDDTATEPVKKSERQKEA